MWKRSRSFNAVIRAAALLLTAGLTFASPTPTQTATAGDLQPTAVAGESWLSHLHRAFDETSMGKTGRLGPPTAMPGSESVRWQEVVPEAVNGAATLHGSDLYRMNCRGCHGPEGQGVPPEINSVINPVRATSAAAVMERMKAVAMDMSRGDAARLARQSKAILLERLHRGGQDMPAFPHLQQNEVKSLIAYLWQLSGVRGAEKEQVAVRESRLRMGEHIVKSTCHICHSAAGPNPSAQQLYEGAIPPLSTLAMRTSRAEFIRKVTQGAPVMMGAPPELFRGRMPVFYYLSEAEAADAYLYLTRYPPYQWAVLDPVPTSSVTGADPRGSMLGPQVTDASFSARASRAATPPTAADISSVDLPVVAGCIVIALLGFGFGFTVCEMKRLSARRQGHEKAADGTARETKAVAAHANQRSTCELVA